MFWVVLTTAVCVCVCACLFVTPTARLWLTLKPLEQMCEEGRFLMKQTQLNVDIRSSDTSNTRGALWGNLALSHPLSVLFFFWIVFTLRLTPVPPNHPAEDGRAFAFLDTGCRENLGQLLACRFGFIFKNLQRFSSMLYTAAWVILPPVSADVLF